MKQPQFEEGPPVPMMTEGVINAATLKQLVADLLKSAVVIQVREKGGVGAYAGPDEPSIEKARDRLLNGTARAVQVRYRYDGHEWSDTILATPAGFRVVRCRHEV